MWSIHELDKDKTIQSIANEEARLDHYKIERERLVNEFNRIQRAHQLQEEKLMFQIDQLNEFIKSGEDFVKECKEHLKSFDNAIN